MVHLSKLLLQLLEPHIVHVVPSHRSASTSRRCASNRSSVLLLEELGLLLHHVDLALQVSLFFKQLPLDIEFQNLFRFIEIFTNGSLNFDSR